MAIEWSSSKRAECFSWYLRSKVSSSPRHVQITTLGKYYLLWHGWILFRLKGVGHSQTPCKSIVSFLFTNWMSASSGCRSFEQDRVHAEYSQYLPFISVGLMIFVFLLLTKSTVMLKGPKDKWDIQNILLKKYMFLSANSPRRERSDSHQKEKLK